MDALDCLVAETAAAKTDDVESTIFCRLTAYYNIRRNVFVQTASTLYHYIAADVTELVYEHAGKADFME